MCSPRHPRQKVKTIQGISDTSKRLVNVMDGTSVMGVEGVGSRREPRNRVNSTQFSSSLQFTTLSGVLAPYEGTAHVNFSSVYFI